MIVSMTGFGTASGTINKNEIKVELRSINSKYLEINTRMPMVFSDKEQDIKEILSKKLSRGKVSVNISLDKSKDKNISFQVQPEIVKD